MKAGDQVQVYGDGPHDGSERGPEKLLWTGRVTGVTATWIKVKHPRRADATLFDAVTGRAFSNTSAEFIKLDVPEAERLDPPPPDPGWPVQLLPSSQDRPRAPVDTYALMLGTIKRAEHERDEALADLADRDRAAQAEIAFQRARAARADRLAWWLFCACAWAVVATALALRGC